MDLPLTMTGFAHPFLSSNQGTLHSQLNNLKAHRDSLTRNSKTDRHGRNAVYRSRMFIHSLPEDVAKFHDQNPEGYGLPRSYKLRYVDPGQDHLTSTEAPIIDKGHRITFCNFGAPKTDISLNGIVLNSKDVRFSNSTKIYTWDATTPSGVAIAGHLNFDAPRPFGEITVEKTSYRVFLEQHALTFKVKVSANAGANAPNNNLQWDDSSDQWKKADWEEKLLFSYNPKTSGDDIERRTVVENFFADTSSEPATLFELRNEQYSNEYTSILSGAADPSGRTSLLSTKVLHDDQIPNPPASRQKSSIHSVFPKELLFRFDAGGGSFTGAYRDKNNNVYAVSGSLVDELMNEAPTPAPAHHLESVKTFLHAVKPVAVSFEADAPKVFFEEEKVEAEGVLQDAHVGDHNSVRAEQFMAIKKGSVMRQSVPTPKASMLVTTSLTNMNPVIFDTGNYTDTIADQATHDFHSIIVYHMDADLRQTFMGMSEPIIDAEVKAIANDDLINNSLFYKKLQVPFLVSMLGKSTLAEGKHCITPRADKLLKELPTNDEVYKRHISKLYTLRFTQRFKEITTFLEDQKSDKSADIKKIGDAMKKNLEDQSKDMRDLNKNYGNELQTAKDDIDSLCKWATDKKLYWAFRLLYWIQKVNMPNWYAQSTTGSMGAGVQIQIKNLTAIFQMLENNQINKEGKSFTEVFQEMLRFFQMTSVVPQMVNLEGNVENIDSILKESLRIFYEKYASSPDPNVVEHATTAKILFQQDQLRKQFIENIAKMQHLGSTFNTWGQIGNRVAQAGQIGGAFEIPNAPKTGLGFFLVMLAAAMIVVPCIPGMGGFKAMKPEQQSQFIMACVGLGSYVVLKLSIGLTRWYAFYEHIATKWDTVKVILGSEKVLKEIGEAANRIENNFGKWFTRTGRQIMGIEAEGILAGANNFTAFQRMFGRNAGEMISTLAGVVLAVVSLVLTAIAISKETDSLLIASDAILIASASLQILAYVAGWTAIAVAGAEVGAAAVVLTVSTFCATWLGPAAVVLAVIGIIVFIVWQFTHKDPPNPVERFLNDKVRPANLYQDHMSIDFFDVVPPGEKSASRPGLSFKAKDAGYLCLKGPPPSLIIVDAIDNTPATVWGISTGSAGLSVISTVIRDKDNRLVYCLGENDSGQLAALLLPSKTKINDAGKLTEVPQADYQKAVAQVIWKVDVVDDPEKDSKDHPLKATINISRSSGKSLVPTGDKKGMELKINAGGSEKTLTIEMQPLGPGPFTYAKPAWKLTTADQEDRNIPVFVSPSDSSSGLTWIADPALPDFIQIELQAGSDEGTLSIKKGVNPKAMVGTKYKITCSLGGGQTNVKAETEVIIEVVEAPKPATP